MTTRAELTPVRHIEFASRLTLFVRVGLRPPPPTPFVPYLLDDVCRASEDLDSHVRSHGVTVLSDPWCRVVPVLDADRYAVLEHGIDVAVETSPPDDWTLRLVREPAHEAVSCSAIGSLADLDTIAAELAQRERLPARDTPGAWRWMWHRVDPEGKAHAVTIICATDTGPAGEDPPSPPPRWTGRVRPSPTRDR